MKCMKRLALLPCLALTASLFSVQAFAAQEPNIVICGDNYVGSCFIESGTTYVPLRSTLDFMGGWDIEWDGAKKTAYAESDDVSLSLSSASNKLTVNGTSCSATVKNVGGRLFLPLRALGNSLGYSVSWDSSSRTATVSETENKNESYSESDLYWLSRIISAESQGESLTGQIAVGNVVMNRVASDIFPNTIYDVIFDKKDAVQFEPVSNGTVYNTPAASSVKAAELVLAGENVIGDCMYFFNPSLSLGTWIVQNCQYYTTIGCHRFYH